VEGKVKASSINGVINASTCNPAWSPNIPSWCAGPDIGAWINAAYAALPASGGIIQVTVPAEGLSFSTPIAISTQSKGAIIECVGDQGVAGTDPIHGLTYTGTSGNAITFNFSGNGKSHQRGAGVRECTLLGSGGTSAGIYLGGSQGAEGVSIDHTHISGFGSAQIQFGNNVWMTEINHSILSGDGIHPLLIASGANNLGENLNFSNTTFIYGTMNGDITFSAGAGGTQANFWGCSFDNVQIVNNGAIINLFAPHFENPGGPINAPYVINAGRMNITNPQFFNDSSLTTATSMVKATLGDLTIVGGDFSSAGYTYPALFELSGSANFYELAPLSLNGSNNNLLTGTTTGRYFVDTGNSCTRAQCQAFLTNSPYVINASSLRVGTDTYNRIGALLDYVTSGNQQLRTFGTLDGWGYFTTKIVGSQSPDCLNMPYSSMLSFYTEQKNTGDGNDTSIRNAYLDCDGRYVVPNGPVIGNGMMVTGLAPNTSPNQLGIGYQYSNSASAGGAGPLPAAPQGYLIWNYGGSNIKIPFYLQ
jgi:hypothetical protein